MTTHSHLQSKTARAKLEPRKKPYFISVSPGICLGYRRNQTVGSWLVRKADGLGGGVCTGFAHADDAEPANGRDILTFVMAQDRARELARGEHDRGGKLPTVEQCLQDYEGVLRAQRKSLGNISRVRFHLPPWLSNSAIDKLTFHALQNWRNRELLAKLKPATVNRTLRSLRAALTHAVKGDRRIPNRDAWQDGLKPLPDTHNPRNTILRDEQVATVVRVAHEQDVAFGLFVEVAALTGSRPSQIARLAIEDLISGQNPRVMMPVSKKGTGTKPMSHKPVPIPASLAARLAQAAAGRAADEPLLLRGDGTAWDAVANAHQRPFERVVERAGLDEAVTIYALRHSSIVRQILAGTPTRCIADAHDTSIGQIERTYSAFISGHSDVLLRKGLLDLAPPRGDNVVALRA